MKKKVIFIFVILVLSLITISCKKETITYNVSFDGDIVSVNEGDVVSEVNAPIKDGYEFVGWYDENNKLFNFDSPITKNIVLVPKYKELINVHVLIDGNEDIVKVGKGEALDYLNHPTKENYSFIGWYKGDQLYDFSSPINEEITIEARFEKVLVTVSYDFGYDCYQTKEELMNCYYEDFYKFLLSKNAPELEENCIYRLSDFMRFMTTWQVYDTRSDLYHTGDAFKNYYLSQDIGGKLEDQPDTHFIGWCYKNGKYLDLINHLIVFFAYWRTDEGYSATDPNGNDFFAHSWSSLVDTAKFFYFTSDTLNIKYPWFNSKRVKDALDNIPGVGYVKLVYSDEEEIVLPQNITRYGYEFLGWYDDDEIKHFYVYDSMTVHATWKECSALEIIANNFMKDYNNFNGMNLKYYQLDTTNLNSYTFVNMAEDEDLYNKWLWLYKLIAQVTGESNKDPEAEGFNWEDNKGFYLANLCGLFTQTKHTDTWLKDESIDYSDEEIMSIVNEVLELHR